MNRDDFKNQNRENFGLKLVPPSEEEIDNRPVVLMIALFAPAVFSSDAIVKGFEENGYRTVVINWQNLKMEEGMIGMWDRVLAKARMESPDLIWLHMQNEASVSYEHIGKLSEFAPIVNYTMDVRNNIDWYKIAGKYIALTCMACKEDVDEMKSEGFNAIVLQSSCDMTFYKPNPKPFVTHGVYTPQIVFIGNNYEHTNLNFPLAKERQEMIKFLKERYGDRFCSYGRGQQENRFINQHEEINLYHSCKIAISHNNFKKDSYTSDRLWRIMASGAFCLTAHFPGIEKIFSGGIHLDWWRDFHELKLLIDMYLSDDGERKAIAKNGTQLVRENHSWADRVKTIKETISSVPHL